MANSKKFKKKKLDLRPIKIITNNAPVNSNKGYFTVLNDGEIVSDYDDCAILPTGFYCSIFGKPLKNRCKESKLLSVVKINYKGNSINRRYIGVNKDNSKSVALTPKSWLLLSGEHDFPNDKEEIYVSVTRGNKFSYFWDHPFHATRISMRLGIIGALIGFISCILTICLSL